MIGCDTAMKVVHFEYKKTTRIDNKEFDHTAFVELFMSYLLKEIQGFITYRSQDICEIKNVTTL